MVPAPVALVFGILAILDIRKSRTTGKPKYGMGRAIFGAVMGAVFSVSLIFMVIALLIG
jgi:hypothetical protein